jgi:hypothetical protein
MRKLTIIGTVVFFLAINLASCAMGSFTRTGKIYPPLNENAQVDVVMRSKPDYKYELIGMAEIQGGSLDQQLNKARKIARENGGDVIILVETGTNYNVSNGQVQSYDVRSFEIAKKIP